jgi:hypothetical protein
MIETLFPCENDEDATVMRTRVHKERGMRKSTAYSVTHATCYYAITSFLLSRTGSLQRRQQSRNQFMIIAYLLI